MLFRSAAGVIEQHAIANRHRIAHEISRLIVAHTRPGHASVWSRQCIVNARLIRLGFHQPVAHRFFVITNEKAVAAHACNRQKEVPPVPLAGIPNLSVQGGHSSSILGSSDERRSRLLNESRSRCARMVQGIYGKRVHGRRLESTAISSFVNSPHVQKTRSKQSFLWR